MNNLSLRVPAAFAHAVFLAGATLPSPVSANPAEVVHVNYQSRQSNSTLLRRGAAYEVQQVDQFQQQLIDFYTGLAAKQQSLPPEVSVALYDNTWDLYAR